LFGKKILLFIAEQHFGNQFLNILKLGIEAFGRVKTLVSKQVLASEGIFFIIRISVQSKLSLKIRDETGELSHGKRGRGRKSA
jgi:hypothetical protein